MKQSKLIAVVLLAFLAGCTSIKVSGLVYDSATGSPIVNGASVSIGSRVARVNRAGRYKVKGRKEWKTMTVSAPGYTTQTVDVDTSTTRTPVVNVPMVSATAARSASKEAPAPVAAPAKRRAAPKGAAPAEGSATE